MNIQNTSMNSYIYQMSQNSIFNAQSTNNQPPPPPMGGEMEISSEGRDMQMMLRDAENANEARNRMEESLSEINIESLDISSMTDEEMTEVLTEYEDLMGEYMHENYTPASEMSSDELSDTLTRLQNISSKLSDTSDYGMQMRPPGGGPRGAGGPPPGGVQGQSEESNTIQTLLDALEEDEDDEESTTDIIESLLDDLESGESTQMFTYRSMEEMLSILDL